MTCDHSILILHDKNEELTIREFKEFDMLGWKIRKYCIVDGRGGYCRKFTYCPDCGEKINWDLIKKEICEA